MKNYFSKSKEELFKLFSVGENGLSNEEAQERLKKYGKNQLNEEEKESTFSVFISQFKDFLVIILIIASIISLISGNVESTIVILVVIVINAILGTVQHVKAEQSINSLKSLSSPKIKVLRNGEKVEISSELVVPGDIMLLEAGDLVPADGRVLESFSLLVNESSLTGESENVEKKSEVINVEELSIGDQKNMVFSGSLVSYGRGVILVTQTGMNTELGKIAKLLESTKQKTTPLQVSLDNFGKKLSVGIIILCIVIFIINLFHGVNILDSLMFAVALAVAAIPEALSSIVTIVLAIGTQKLSKENAIVKKLKSVESLGCVGVICSDKTGTLTQNKMTVKKVYISEKVLDASGLDKDNKIDKLILQESILCNDATNDVGDPTEIALVNLADKYGIDFKELKHTYPRISEIPFDSDRKLMSTVHKIDNDIIMFTKGAVDSLVPRITHILINNEVREIKKEDIKKIEETNNLFAETGLRVLTYAYKILNSEKEISLEDENNYIFIGLVGMIDPPRAESKAAVEKCIMAGIKPVMITGDHKVTARTIAREIGIYHEGDRVIEGLELEKMTDEELKAQVERTSVYARVSPEHKIRIVNAWQSLGKICAMTGDGVNDAPALKKADIGIAMGITGTEVSKDAASMILTDDNFSTIVKAITTGRNIYANIKNSIRFLLSGNTAAIIAVIYSSFAGLPVIFAPVHLLFINLLTDSLPAIAIGMEPSHGDVLKDKPRDPKEPILTNSLAISILIEGLIIAIFVVIGYYIGYGSTKDALKGSTIAFSVLCLARLFHGFNCRGKHSIFGLGISKNMFSIIAFIIGFVLLSAVLLIPGLHGIFEVAPISMRDICIIYVLAFIPSLLIQLYKIIKYKK
ncbi:cation-translocating P-type ATPase [Fusobacterium hominis]|jgi:Ca2+-transporting ATPase|uniref:Cation-translocating P-type ATPase n=1 Tax=Fusobacterium hominis TaxID=2764326 RepID=A0A7G9GYL8_9FUSO|nr:cation-translocating P-type ATPase [Fusobacterium hominis]QNM15900.1 cation-translocating P-type ATPase [Fusobacterium hominis]